MEKDFDEVAEGKENWHQMMADFYNELEPQVEEVMNQKTEHKVGERVLGTDPATGREVSVKIGRFGPVVQIGSATDTEKPRFAQLGKGQSLQSVTLEEALELFKLPRTLGQYEGKDVIIGTGRFGPYVQHNRKYASLPKDADPMAFTLEEAIELIQQKRSEDAQRQLKSFDEEPELKILNGRYGPYLTYKGDNFRLPKSAGDPLQLTAQQCLDIIARQTKK